ncbi:MAG: hypothetical protein V4739_10755 [Pseudomonadota bacterium]
MTSPFFSRRLAGLAALGAMTLGLGGCAGTLGRLPAPEVLQALPVVAYGQPKPAQGDYIVHLRAREPITADAQVRGNLFVANDQKTLSVQLKRDLYLYKHWLSHDKVSWRKADEAVGGTISVQLPGYARPNAGEILIELNEKP